MQFEFKAVSVQPCLFCQCQYIVILFYYYHFISVHKNYILYNDYVKLINIFDISRAANNVIFIVD